MRRVEKVPKKDEPAESNKMPYNRPILGMEDMVARIPKGKEYLTTKELQHVCNDCHRGTIYRYVTQKRITPVRTYGMASRYRTKDVLSMIKEMFSPKRR